MTSHPARRSLQLVALLLATTAAASTLVGNPLALIALDSGSAVDVGDVRAYTCPGYQDFPVDDVLTVGEPLTVTLGTGTWCALALQVEWAGTSGWDLVPVDGFDTFQTVSTGSQRTIVLDPTTKTATLE